MKFISDEDFNNRIVRGLLRRFPELDLVRVQDVGLTEKHDTEVLAWSGREGRLVLTHDFATMLDFAYSRVADALEMPGVIAVPQDLPIGEAIAELSTLIECSLENEWKDQVVFIPLRN
jgi:predicted nuclease of predicted toxin-antitoxin system